MKLVAGEKAESGNCRTVVVWQGDELVTRLLNSRLDYSVLT